MEAYEILMNNIHALMERNVIVSLRHKAVKAYLSIVSYRWNFDSQFMLNFACFRVRIEQIVSTEGHKSQLICRTFDVEYLKFQFRYSLPMLCGMRHRGSF